MSDMSSISGSENISQTQSAILESKEKWDKWVNQFESLIKELPQMDQPEMQQILDQFRQFRQDFEEKLKEFMNS